jgi:hypothetical protein
VRRSGVNAKKVQRNQWVQFFGVTKVMPKGPRGERRPSDVIGTAITVAKIATGELEDDIRPLSGRVRSGKAGGKARAERLSAEDRSKVARKAASARWRNGDCSEVESDMGEQKKADRPQTEELLLMYPSNQLGEQVRDYEQTRGVAALFRELFDNN